MAEFSKYKVILSGEMEPGFERQEVLEGLAKLFNSKVGKMEPLLGGKAVPLKKKYDNREARLICKKILKAGAQCIIEEIEESPIELIRGDSLQPASGNTGEQPLQLPQSDIQRDQDYPLDTIDGDDPTEDQATVQEKLSRLVGVNSEYYLKQFERFGSFDSPKFQISWHWPAFFFFFLWALYRKLWAWAIFYLAAGTAMMLVTSPGLLHLVWMLAWPLCANFIYFRKVSMAIAATDSALEFDNRIYSTGGVSRLAASVGFTVVMISFLFSINNMTARFMEEYGDEIRDVGQGSGTQLRGDGSALGEIISSNTKLARTSLTLSTLAVYLKVLLVADNEQKGHRALAEFLEKLSNEKIKDAWGNIIQVEESADSYLLVSAGPDGIFDSDDDILQPMSIP
jgi:hypothetical protein